MSGHLYEGQLIPEIPAIPEDADGVVDFEDDILCYYSFVPWCDDLIRTAEVANKWRSSTEDDDVDVAKITEKRTSNQVIISRQVDVRFGRFEDALVSLFGRAVELYRSFNPHFLVKSFEGFTLLRYQKGQGYGEHVDAYDPVRTPRLLSMLLYLNHDYDGGELAFPRQGREHKLPTSYVVVFPSLGTHPHEARPVKSGTRYVVVTWAS